MRYAQHPGHATIQLSINTLQIRKCHLLVQNHLVEADNKVCVQEAPVEYTEAEAAADELEVVEMLRIDTRSRVNLEGIVVVRRVLKQTVEGIEHFV
jgi:hypothetical protein